MSAVTFVAFITLLLSNLLLLQLHGLAQFDSIDSIISSNTENQDISTVSYQAAFDQSYGFFDDISDTDWKTYYQEPALASKHYNYPGNHDKRAKTPHRWIFSNWDPYFNCPHKRKIGGLGDGSKWTCDPHRLRRIPVADQRASLHNGKSVSACLVYSIGSNKNYKFEKGLFDLLGSICEIHIFDPDPDDAFPDKKENNMFFHQWGLGSSYSEGMKRQGSGVFLTFQEIRRRLDHENRTIDIFKIDCEGCEWHSYKDWIEADLRQVLIETHDLPLPEMRKRTDYGIFPAMAPSDFFDAFYRNNFVLFSKEVNTQNGHGRSAEWSFLKLHHSFFQPISN